MTDIRTQDTDFLPPDVSAALNRAIAQRVEDQLGEVVSGTLTKGEYISLMQANDKRTALVERIWHNDGWLNPSDRQKYSGKAYDEHRVSYRDLVHMIDRSAADMREKAEKAGTKIHDNTFWEHSPLVLPKVILNIVRQAAEPLLTLTSLMRSIRFSAGTQVTFPAMGAMTASDIAPGQEYPAQRMDFSGHVTANIGKSGIKVHMVEETLRYSMFDLMSLYLQAAGRALARHKETKIASLILSEGSVAFDNNTPSLGLHQSQTQGRGLDMNYNGGMVLDDLFVMWADLMRAGFVPDTILLNPMGWLLFTRDADMRALAFQAGNGSMLYNTPTGRPSQAPMWGPMGVSGGSFPSLTPGQQNRATTAPKIPSFFPVPFRVVVSPFIPYDTTANTTHVIVADSAHFGILLVDEEPTTESWDDPERDMTSTKIRERYGLALDNEGKAVISAKNISMKRTYDAEHLMRWTAGTGDIPAPSGVGLYQ